MLLLRAHGGQLKLKTCSKQESLKGAICSVSDLETVYGKRKKEENTEECNLVQHSI